ncbi:MAG: hypothetical protein PHE89_03535 [Alphaproteobacteria bacterium]|nr:hypothetical protein [Alphaproteobacteria bacterium]
MEILWSLYYKIINYIDSPEFASVLINNRFWMILLVVFLVRLKYSTYSSMWMSALVNIPGTFLHELMHFFVGGFLNAQPCNFSVFPKKNLNGEYVMGSVGFRNITFYNALPAAMAPLLLLPIAFLLNRYWLPEITPSTLNYVFYILLQTIIIENAIPSGQDFKVAGRFFSGVVIYICLLCFVILAI